MRPFKNKIEAHQRAVKVYQCKSCSTQHLGKKPFSCSQCNYTEFYRCDSKKEAKRLNELILLQKFGEITGLHTQVTFRIDVNGCHICRYVADFMYRRGVETIVEDVKGNKDFTEQAFKLKRKLVGAIYGHKINVIS